MKKLGVVKTSVYIYMTLVVTVIMSVLILHEPLTILAGVGMIFTLLGLFLSEAKPAKEKLPFRSQKTKAQKF